MNQTQNNNRFGNWIRNSITARMLMVGTLVLVLLIPLAYIENLISERAMRQDEVVSEINQKWGEEVLIYGPMLKVPYKVYKETTYTDQNTKKVKIERTAVIRDAYFFPEKLEVVSTINPEEKKRGIYKTAVYQSNMQLIGKFKNLDFSDADVQAKDVLWEKARIIIKTSNTKGVDEKVVATINNNKYEFTSKYEAAKKKNFNDKNQLNLYTLQSKLLAVDDSPKEDEITISLNLSIKGSKQIRFIPVGKETKVEIASNWKTANFIGNFLPYNSNKITETGFDAKWKVLDINRPFAQQYFNSIPSLNAYAFGVNFMIPVDEYQKSERSAKYGFLVIALTFLVFFLIQTLSKIHIHPFQYLMIGLALIMFYTLLISISEHSSYLKAYLVAGVSVVLLITLYSKTILKIWKFPMFIFSSLTALYTFIFVIIQLENYALLVGSVGLFVILAAVMFVSRKIDWQNG